MIDLWKKLGRPAQGRFLLALALSALAGASGTILLGLSGWFLTSAALAGLGGAGYVYNHLYPSAGVRLAAFSRVLARYAEQLVGHDATLRLSARLRPALFVSGAAAQRGMTPMPADELSSLIDDVDAAEAGFLKIFAPAAAVSASLAIAIGFTLAANAWLGMVAFLLAITVAWYLPSAASRRSMAAAERLATQTRAAREDTARLIENAVELDVIGALPQQADSARTRLEDQLHLNDGIERPYRLMGAVTALCGMGLALAVLWIANASSLGLAIAVGAALALMSAFESTGAMVSVFDAFAKARAATQRLAQRLAIIQSPWEASPSTAKPLTTAFPIVADGLQVRAAPRAPRTSPVSFRIEPGTLVQIIGPSGSGKTTLAETLMRLHPTAGGKLTYAGASADDVRIASALDHIALSPQFPAFLPGTLEGQFLLAAPDASEEDINAALETACAVEFISARGSLRSIHFGEGDLPFSGGELRRIGLARALLARPEILILDEPFAGLEPALAERLARNLADWAHAGQRAIVLLAHEPISVQMPGLQPHTIRITA
ncbi:MAG: ATP-binding cassette domain-containing protein [Hyphomonas sp.]|uniref:ATP-binding cassette domain-containing protein n=1 Tax=Hyphomonas sp. TaxID=87 RepID=UPI003528F2C4